MSNQKNILNSIMKTLHLLYIFWFIDPLVVPIVYMVLKMMLLFTKRDNFNRTACISNLSKIITEILTVISCFLTWFHLSYKTYSIENLAFLKNFPPLKTVGVYISWQSLEYTDFYGPKLISVTDFERFFEHESSNPRKLHCRWGFTGT